jgi:hypothetical protein
MALLFELIVISAALVAVFMGVWELCVWFWPEYLCHVCHDENKKMSWFEYRRNHGRHAHCAPIERLESHADDQE